MDVLRAVIGSVWSFWCTTDKNSIPFFNIMTHPFPRQQGQAGLKPQAHTARGTWTACGARREAPSKMAARGCGSPASGASPWWRRSKKHDRVDHQVQAALVPRSVLPAPWSAPAAAAGRPGRLGQQPLVAHRMIKLGEELFVRQNSFAWHTQSAFWNMMSLPIKYDLFATDVVCADDVDCGGYGIVMTPVSGNECFELGRRRASQLCRICSGSQCFLERTCANRRERIHCRLVAHLLSALLGMLFFSLRQHLHIAVTTWGCGTLLVTGIISWGSTGIGRSNQNGCGSQHCNASAKKSL